jgi:hypothetical protein
LGRNVDPGEKMVTRASKNPTPSAPAVPEASAVPAGTGAPEAQSATAPGQTRVVWDDTNMRTSYANVCNVLGTREEITLLFGSNQSWQIGQDQVRVVLTDRVVLNPYTAKRLLIMLEKGMREYEARFGVLAL